MYRSYEDPYKLESLLEKRMREYESLRLSNPDSEDLVDLSLEIAELKDRINFAWQDDEFDSYH